MIVYKVMQPIMPFLELHVKKTEVQWKQEMTIAQFDWLVLNGKLLMITLEENLEVGFFYVEGQTVLIDAVQITRGNNHFTKLEAQTILTNINTAVPALNNLLIEP